MLPKVEMLSGENHRERVLSLDEDQRYLAAASAQSYLLRDVVTILIDCALRPEECFRLNVRFGKTENARRSIPMPQGVAAQLDMRKTDSESEWIFPAPTVTGHIEKSTLKKQHKKAPAAAKVKPFTLYTFRHTCLTRWAAFMNPLHAGDTIKAPMERARGGHSESETTESAKPSPVRADNDFSGMDGRGEWIRTTGLLVPNQALYQAEPRPDETMN